MTILDTTPELAPLRSGANHVDVKTAECEATLREFAAGALSWQPVWLKAMFRARAPLARMMRLRESRVRLHEPMRPEEVPFTPGTKTGFFTVAEAVEDHYLVMEAADSHLTAYLVIIASPEMGEGGRASAFEVGTVVKYHRWTGPVYFNIIRPFHHLVVSSMTKAGVRACASRERSS